MNILVGAHLVFVALGLGGAAALYAGADSDGREHSERITWIGLIGALVTGPVYGLSHPDFLDTVVMVKVAVALLIAATMYRFHGSYDEMDVRSRSTSLLGVLVLWLVAFFLGVQAAHP